MTLAAQAPETPTANTPTDAMILFICTLVLLIHALSSSSEQHKAAALLSEVYRVCQQISLSCNRFGQLRQGESHFFYGPIRTVATVSCETRQTTAFRNASHNSGSVHPTDPLRQGGDSLRSKKIHASRPRDMHAPTMTPGYLTSGPPEAAWRSRRDSRRATHPASLHTAARLRKASLQT